MTMKRTLCLMLAAVLLLLTGATAAFAAESGWVSDSRGWWYRDGAGGWPADCWRALGGRWYHFGPDGYMDVGWLWDGGKWYHLSSSGAMDVGWLWDDGRWYHLSPSGAMDVGWLWDDGRWYHLSPSGAMDVGWLWDDGRWYHLAPSGAMDTGWVWDGEGWYWLEASGAMARSGTVDGYALGKDGRWLDTPQAVLADMTLWEKICQLFILRPGDLDPAAVTAAGASFREAAAAFPAGGFIYSLGNMSSQAQVSALLADVRAAEALPPIACCDEEGGVVSRLMRNVGTTWFDSMYTYRNAGAATARDNARTIAADMGALGFNLDLAPVADVWSNPSNTVIGRRAYSDDFTQAAELVAAAVEGFHAGGVGCTLKHFPGHGDTAEDSHTGAAYVTKTLDQLRQEELLPFAAGIEAGADAVMIGHLTVTAAGQDPAPFSYALVTELLREELGFEGVVMTDALGMGALAGYGDGETALRCLSAGVDMLLCPEDPWAAALALWDAAAAGELTEARLDESVLRILTLKFSLGILR